MLIAHFLINYVLLIAYFLISHLLLIAHQSVVKEPYCAILQNQRFDLLVCLSVCLFACLFVCLSVCLFVCLLVCLFICLFVCLFLTYWLLLRNPLNQFHFCLEKKNLKTHPRRLTMSSVTTSKFNVHVFLYKCPSQHFFFKRTPLFVLVDWNEGLGSP